jgi:serine phosphatase RsbU (regulator of sigma subunit)/tetratricopeptide (TPR) repeat protein
MKLILKLGNGFILRLAYILFFSFVLFGSKTYSQVKDKNWLLLDSIDYPHIHSTNKQLLDSILIVYHKATHDSVRLELLNYFVENCSDDILWPKYNDYMLEMAKKGDGSKFYLIYQAAALNNKGFNADSKGNVVKAIDYYTQALKIREQAGDKKGIAESINNLGTLYSYQDDMEATITYYLKALKIYGEIKDEEGSAQTLNNLGITYNIIHETKKAIEYNTKALHIQQKVNDLSGMANSFVNLGGDYKALGDTAKAIEYYLKSLKIREQLDAKSEIAASLYSLASIYYNIKDFKKAKECADRSLQLAKELGFPIEIENASRVLYLIYKKQNNAIKALEMFELYVQMHDSTSGIEQVREATSSKYKWEEQQQQLEHEKQTAIAVSEQKKQRLFMLLIVCVAIATAIIALIVYKNLQRYKKAKRIIEKQKELVEEKQKEILDSIRYAKRIQDAVLKEQEHVSVHLPGHFVLFQPKDIVSGDFYWSIEKDNYWYIAAADCTGHGVPGAFLTILGTSFLNELTATDALLTPAEILDKLRSRMIAELSVTNNETNETKDGMDISLARLNLVTKELMWAGANNPLWIVGKNKQEPIIEIPAHKQPIGFYPTLSPYPNHLLQLTRGDTFYLFTDGYADQFGGEKGKKLKYKAMKDLLVNNNNYSMDKQKQILVDFFTNWKRDYEQTDDVCIIGINIL